MTIEKSVGLFLEGTRGTLEERVVDALRSEQRFVRRRSRREAEGNGSLYEKGSSENISFRALSWGMHALREEAQESDERS